MNLDIPYYRLSDVSELAKVDLAILRQWVSRGLFPKAGRDVEGKLRMLTPRTAIAIAIASRLNDHGLSITRIAKIARTLADHLEERDGKFVFVEDPIHGGEIATEAFAVITVRDGEHQVEIAPDMNGLPNYFSAHIDDEITVINCSLIVKAFEEKQS